MSDDRRPAGDARGTTELKTPSEWAATMGDDELLDRMVGVDGVLPKAVAEEVKRRFLAMKGESS